MVCSWSCSYTHWTMRGRVDSSSARFRRSSRDEKEGARYGYTKVHGPNPITPWI